jgi:hypothetical protein
MACALSIAERDIAFLSIDNHNPSACEDVIKLAERSLRRLRTGINMIPQKKILKRYHFPVLSATPPLFFGWTP